MVKDLQPAHVRGPRQRPRASCIWIFQHYPAEHDITKNNYGAGHSCRQVLTESCCCGSSTGSNRRRHAKASNSTRDQQGGCSHRHCLATRINKNIPRAYAAHAVLVWDGSVSSRRCVVATRGSAAAKRVGRRTHSATHAGPPSGLPLLADVIHCADHHDDSPGRSPARTPNP